MKIYSTILVLAVLILSSVTLQAQPSTFSLEAYSQFLQQNQNMSAQQLMEQHSAGLFLKNAPTDWNAALYHDSIEIKYGLTDYEKSLIGQHGFVVSERIRRNSFMGQFANIWHKELPVFVSTDAILHAFHESYDRILQDVEFDFLIDDVEALLNHLHGKMAELEIKYAGQSAMQQFLKDVDVYLTVPRKIYNSSLTPYYSENTSQVNELLNLIFAEQPAAYALFASTQRLIDFSQFKPRGHYTENKYFKKYFRAMMWLGRTEIYLLAPENVYGGAPQPTDEDIQRQTIDAMLIAELIELANAQSLFDKIEHTISVFVGEQDNVTLAQLQSFIQAVSLSEAAQLLDTLRLQEFQDTLKTKPYASQQILSQLLHADPMSPDKLEPASAFLLFGQRFVVDSYITGSVVYDRITYNDQKIHRLFPSTLDILFALGNAAAAQLLMPELNKYYYSANLTALRYLVESYDQEFWQSSIYNLWLLVLRTLNAPENRSALPPFMQTAAWNQEKMNTQLSSWTELRHDNLLYAKQSYTAMEICSYPFSYVEPIPDFYSALTTLADITKTKLTDLPFTSPSVKSRVISYFDSLQYISAKLAVIAQKELDSVPFNSEEISFLQSMIKGHGMCGEAPYDGWYAQLYYKDAYWDGEAEDGCAADFIVADYHTTPTDEYGNMIGWILHAGTGAVDMLIVPAQLPDGKPVAFIGPVASYHEYTTTNFLRLTDEEWAAQYMNLSLRPDWVNLYLADSTGHSRGAGASLFTGINNDQPRADVPSNHLMAVNYPNPFNQSTVISFQLSVMSRITLKIYDLQGRLIRTLVDERLSPGNYLTRWDGMDEKDYSVASGIYFYKLETPGWAETKRMLLIR